jgi:alanyl-tRNA synthetase
LHAGNIIKQIAKEIEGGGGGQDTFATASGKNPANLELAIDRGRQLIIDKFVAPLG